MESLQINGMSFIQMFNCWVNRSWFTITLWFSFSFLLMLLLNTSNWFQITGIDSLSRRSLCCIYIYYIFIEQIFIESLKSKITFIPWNVKNVSILKWKVWVVELNNLFLLNLVLNLCLHEQRSCNGVLSFQYLLR